MLESVFRSLFKYDRLIFEQGQFVLGATQSMWLTVAIAAAIALYVLWTYWSLSGLRTRDKAVLIGVRTALLAVALFAVLRPMLLLKSAVPQQNFVGVLLDDSRSMQVADEAGRPRYEFVQGQFGKADAPLLAALGQRFVPRVFRFSSSAERLQSSGDLQFQGTATRLGDALDRAREEMLGQPVAGFVLVTDGADNADVTVDQAIAGLKSQGIPVFSIGVGREQFARDIEVTRVETPRRALKGTSLVVDLVVTQSGFAGARVPLIVEDGGRLVNTQEITLPPDGEAATVKVRFKLTDQGARSIRFRIPVQATEEVTQNNQRDALIDVHGRSERILYVEGEPRWEPKFVLQATEPDDGLGVVLLQRTAEATVNAPDKYYRRGVTSPEELQAGFPATREELFGYRGLIVGSIEASAFTPEQQRMIEEFVDVRGGGLLVLGGDRSFAEGGWLGTPLADALPIGLTASAKAPIYPPLELVVQPTVAGRSHPAAQIADTEEAAAAKWKELPTLTAVNAASTSDLKPGATPLLVGVDRRGREQVVLAYQRYGRGKTLALPVQDTWMWRMHASMDVEDATHHTFWQRLARWLVDGVPDRVMVSAAPDRVQKGEPVTLSAEVLNAEYRPVNDGRVTARVTSPSGAVEEVPLEWSVETAGLYQARFTPTEDGTYAISASGLGRDSADLGRGAASLRVAPSEAEYFGAAMRAPLLRRLAEETEGRFFPASQTSALIDAITYSGKGVTVVEERELFDMPIVLVLLLGLMGGEWLYRRSRGLA